MLKQPLALSVLIMLLKVAYASRKERKRMGGRKVPQSRHLPGSDEGLV